MKVKITTPSIAHMTQTGGQINIAATHTPTIKLKAVTNDERERLRIPSYQYILP